ncbi:hypothetical protein MFM001_23230 [Mycobacterium sp. MFM001]|nr:hypothetical protein MFM001_23230 [Mycobacterium sp. MFM001]
MAISTGQVSVGTTPTKLFTSGPAPISRALVYSSAAAFIGGSAVTSTTGLPIPATTLVEVPLTGAEDDAVYAVVGSGTATVSYFFVA